MFAFALIKRSSCKRVGLILHIQWIILGLSYTAPGLLRSADTAVRSKDALPPRPLNSEVEQDDRDTVSQFKCTGHTKRIT